MAEWCAEHLRDVEGWRSAGLPISTTSNECAKLYDAALRQFVSWTDCHQLNGLEKTLEAMNAADATAGKKRLIWQNLNFSYLHGMLAFGLEECEQYEEAEKEALKALEANKYDCWATHARAHVLEMQGRFREGITFLESTVDDWKQGWMLAAHNYWHNALYYIEKEQNYEVPLTIFDNEICPRAVRSGAMLDMVDAVSLLWRLELEGVNVGDRWHNLPNLKEHVDDHVLFFNDIHMSTHAKIPRPFANDYRFLLVGIALQKGGYVDDEAKMRRSLLEFASSADDDYTQAKVCREVGVAISDGIRHYISGNYDSCAKSMVPIRDRIVTIGGSNAQRDLFTQTIIHACINSSDPDVFSKAPMILDERNAIKKNSPINERLALEFRRRHPL
ncbi:hypothetical protein OESDEN_09442 [Oesophagostomum dentatum]|uniref:Tetratricopeptide repeat protein 38 n=1 Tax=Oesophagostomum dentatum TaxID=61180 RepID=A0A0B1T0G4_OESDE|nr:hypothetical protein OESDEN_09442 [Oesophagostomum dentatum]